MTDKETLKAILLKVGLNIHEEKTCFTIVTDYKGFLADEDQCIHTQFAFNDDGSLKTCRGYRGEDY